MGDVVRIGDDIFGEAAILGIAAEFRVGTDRLPCGQAMFAVTAGRVEPRYSDPVAFSNNLDTGPDRGNAADGLMTGNERQLWLQRPIACRRMEIRVAHAAGLGLDQDLARTK
jgi:hypothetical protein